MARKTPLEALYWLEFEFGIERYIRYTGVAVGGVFYFVNYGRPGGLFWIATTILTHLGLQGLLLQIKASPRQWVQMLVVPITALIMVSVLWFPVAQIIAGPTAATFGGAGIIACFFLYGLARHHHSFQLMVVWYVVLFVVLIILLLVFATRVGSPTETAGMAMAAAGVGLYFGLAMDAQSRYRKARDAAAAKSAQEQKLAAIGRLAGGIAHDFNNLLTGISGNLELFEHMPDDAEKRAVIDEARMSAKRAESLVKQLLIYARKSGLDLRPTEVSTVFDDTTALCRRLLPANISIETDLPIMPLWFMVDRDHMTTALINLLINAADAMPEGGRAVLSARRKLTDDQLEMIDGTMLPPGCYVSLIVTDEGEGIPADLVHKVVEPFFTTKGPGKGTGLGLSTLLGLVQRLSGGLRIQSRHPGGTRVELLLPEFIGSEYVSPSSHGANPVGQGQGNDVPMG